MDGQCQVLTKNSAGAIRATIRRFANANGFVERLREFLSGSNVRRDKLESIGAAITTAADPVAAWQEVLHELEMLADFKPDEEGAGQRPNTAVLMRAGLSASDLDKIAARLFALLVSGQQRRELVAAKQALATRALSDKQFGKRHTRAQKIKIVRDAQLEGLSRAYDIQKQALDQRQQWEIAAQKNEWQALSVERKRLWAQWEQEFGPRQTQRQGQGSGSSSGDRQAPARPRRQFADTNQNPVKKPAQAANSPVKKKFEDKAVPAPEPDPAKPWRQRRSAAERKADGSYKPRQRPPKPKM